MCQGVSVALGTGARGKDARDAVGVGGGLVQPRGDSGEPSPCWEATMGSHAG